MRFPQVVVFENDGALAAHLRPWAAEGRWLLREPRQIPACLDSLRAGGPTVLVMRLGRHLFRELTLLDEAATAHPDVPIIVVTDTEDAALMSLILDLGASYVLMPPQPRNALPELVERMMRAEQERGQRRNNLAPPLDPATPTEAGHDD